LAKGLRLILANLFEDPSLNKVNSEEFLLELREFMYSQPFQIPARTLFLGKSLLTIIGICGGLNPQLDLIKTLRPYAEELLTGVDSGTESQGFAQGFILNQAKKTFSEAITLPERLNRLITGLEVGEIRIQPAKSFELNLLQSQRDQTSRIVRAIFSSGFLISGSILLEGSFFKVGLILLLLSALSFVSLLKRDSNSMRIRHRGQRSSAMREASSSGFRKPRFHP
jgi:predicted unusual protein kinase regulating ubiquinone biosynthesis (AarF/ABC1/UbiB family)